MILTHEERLAKAIELNKVIASGRKAGQITIKEMIVADALSGDELEELVDLYPEFKVGVAYVIGDIIGYNNALYKVVQAHTSQADWIPSAVSALFTPVVPVGIVPDFIQPTGAQDAYMIGDKVLFNGQTYESIIDNNAWSLADYPQGWKLI